MQSTEQFCLSLLCFQDFLSGIGVSLDLSTALQQSKVTSLADSNDGKNVAHFIASISGAGNSFVHSGLCAGFHFI